MIKPELYGLSFFGHRIFIDKEALNFSLEEFKGGLAHEFAHIIIDRRKSFFMRLSEYSMLVFSKLPEHVDERNADILVMERGLGEELLQFHKEHEKEYEAYIDSEGLTKKEIKKLLKLEISLCNT